LLIEINLTRPCWACAAGFIGARGPPPITRTAFGTST